MAITMRAEKPYGNIEMAWLLRFSRASFHNDDLFYQSVVYAATIGEIAMPGSERISAGILRQFGSNLGDILFVCRPD